jgi:hypothetical protein
VKDQLKRQHLYNIVTRRRRQLQSNISIVWLFVIECRAINLVNYQLIIKYRFQLEV